MLNAKFNSALNTALLSSLILLVACDSPEEKKAAQIVQARSYSEEGDTSEALEILEKLSEQYPNDEEILGSIGLVYTINGDFKTAAFFLEQAHLQAPNDNERLYLAYQGLEAANLPAEELLEKIANQATDRMTPELWVRLGEIRQNKNKLQPALEAYLKGADPETTKPSSEVAASIGDLFVKIGNLSQAEIWLQIAASEEGPNALTALFGLLEINLRQQDWVKAENIIAQLDKQFPGAIDASEWEETRQQIVSWREAQNAMKAELSKVKIKERQSAEQINVSNRSYDNSAVIEGKDQVIADLDTAEAMAEMPALEAQTNSRDSDIENINNPEVGTSEVSTTEAPIYPIETDDPGGISYPSEDSNTSDIEITNTQSDTGNIENLNSPEVTEAPKPRTIQELLSDARAAELKQDYKSAITNYWTAMGLDNNRADVWNLLSRTYLIDGQIANADIAALEAVRLEPLTVSYTLDYLRVAQKSKAPDSFLAQLEIAYSRFPENAEIILSLARAHERISEQNVTARRLYLRFIEIAPTHPLIPEAESAIARL